MGIAERKEREREQRRKAILDAAESLFFSKGIPQTTMDEIANQAELSKGTLYLYFNSKSDIQFAIFQRGADILTDMMRTSIIKQNTGHQNLLVLGRTFIKFSEKHRDYFSLFIEIEASNLNELNIEKGALEHYFIHQSPLSLVNECVDQGMSDGSIRNDLDPGTLGAVLWSQLLGVLTVIHHHQPLFRIFEIKPEDILETHLNIVQFGGVPRKEKS